MQEDENAVKILMEKGADPNTRDSEGRNALMVMSMEYRTEGARFGLKMPPPLPKPDSVRSRATLGRLGGPQNQEVEALHDRALKLIDEALVRPDRAVQLIGEALLKAGCDVNAADSNGRTPLMYAVLYSRATAVRLLLQGGANIKSKDKEGVTALDFAKQSNNQEIIQLIYQSAGFQPVTIHFKR